MIRLVVNASVHGFPDQTISISTTLPYLDKFDLFEPLADIEQILEEEYEEAIGIDFSGDEGSGVEMIGQTFDLDICDSYDSLNAAWAGIKTVHKTAIELLKAEYGEELGK